MIELGNETEFELFHKFMVLIFLLILTSTMLENCFYTQGECYSHTCKLISNKLNFLIIFNRTAKRHHSYRRHEGRKTHAFDKDPIEDHSNEHENGVRRDTHEDCSNSRFECSSFLQRYFEDYYAIFEEGTER